MRTKESLAILALILVVFMSSIGCPTEGGSVRGRSPGVSLLLPAQGPTEGGTVVLIRGENFSPDIRVFFGENEATHVTVADTHTLAAVVPAVEESGVVDVRLDNPLDATHTFTSGFTYYQAEDDPADGPTLAAVVSNQGPLDGGSVIEIRGESFSQGALVFFGGRVARDITRVSAELLTVATPPGAAAGTVDVAVSNLDGRSVRQEEAFAYYDPTEAGPNISRIAPTQGFVGGDTQVVIAGTEFKSGLRVYIGGRPATGVGLVGDEVHFNTPPGTVGLRDVAVTNPDGQSSLRPRAFNYFMEPPQIHRVEPAEGSRDGGTHIVILGRAFHEGTQFLVDDVPVEALTIVDDRSATAVTPLGRRGGYVDVAVVSSNALADRLPSGFYYIDADHPPLGDTGERLSVLRVSPSTGPTAGGTSVTLLGTGFRPDAVVTIGDESATDVRVLGPTTITARTPAGAPGPATVTVTNTDGNRSSLELGFTYFSEGTEATAPHLSGISPNTGPNRGGTRALLTGTNFVPGTRVFFGNAEATGVTISSISRITLDVPPAGAPGAVNVTVVVPSGASGQLVSGFVYYTLTADAEARTPSISSVSPNQGLAGEATSVRIRGDLFQPGALVFFGRQAADTVVVTAGDSLDTNAPPAPAEIVDVTVTNPDGLSYTRNGAFTYVAPPPDVSSITPATGPLAGQITVLVVGSGFAPGAQVVFGPNPSTDSTVTDGLAIRAVVPAGPAGVVNVTVRNPDGQQDVLPEAFRYDPDWAPAPPPALVEVLPGQGPTTGGSVVIVRGEELDPRGEIYFGDTKAGSFYWVSAEEITVETPPGPEGHVHVTWMNPDGQLAVIAGGFKYVLPSSLGPRPILGGVTPSAGPESATTDVLVSGEHLSANAFIFFGGVLASDPVRLSANLYRAKARQHPAGAVDVAITHPDGQSAVLRGGFTYVPRPRVTGLLPESGRSAGGTDVTITGTAFQPGALLWIGEEPATSVQVVSATLIQALSPAGPAGLARVLVRNPDGQEGFLDGAFSFVPPPAFAETDPLRPSSGPHTGGSIIEVHGTGFQPGVTLTVRGGSAQVERMSSELLVAVTPAGSVGTADIVVTNPDGQQATLTGGFTYRDAASLGPAPTLTAPTPAAGPSTGGSRVQINGSNFADGSRVFFDMRPGTTTRYLSPASLATTTPAHPVGRIVLAVTGPDGQTARLVDGFEYLDAASLDPPPTIALVTPQTASRFGGTEITIDGTGYVTGAVAFFGGLPANTTVQSDTRGRAVAPAHNEGPALVQITNPDGQTATFAGAFNFIIPPPSLAYVEPSAGPTDGGSPVSLIGADLHPDVVVTFGGTPAVDCSWTSANRVECLTPPGSDGPVEVRVTNPDGSTAALAGGFVYAAPPRVTGVSPTSGPDEGGTRITVTGYYFKTGSTVSVGGVTATAFEFISANAVRAITPPGTGPAEVRVTNPDGQYGAKAGGFTYLPPVPPPTLTGLSPGHGSELGGTTVTITGTGLQAGAQVFFGPHASTYARVNSPTYISAVSTPGAVGAADVRVENPDGQSATLVGGFEYYAEGELPPLAVDDIHPARGPVDGGNRVTVFGRGFRSGAVIAIGGNLCSDPDYIGPGAITCTAPAGLPGLADVQVTNPGGESAALLDGYIFGDGGALIVAHQPIPPESHADKNALLLFDIDNDGDVDFLALNQAFSQVLWNDGGGTMIPGSTTFLARSNGLSDYFAHAVEPADITGNGYKDVIVRGSSTGANHHGLWVFQNVGGAFQEIQRLSGTAYHSWPMLLADVNGNGSPDLLWATNTGVRVFLNDQTGQFTESTGAFPGVTGTPRRICVADVDNDGDNDVFVANDLDQQNRLYLNNGSGQFVDVTSTHLGVLGGDTWGCLIADINNDGWPDLIAGNDGQQDRVLINDGTGRFNDMTPGWIPADTDGTHNLFLVDVNFDGRLDLVADTSGSPRERVYLADITGQFVFANADMVPDQAGPAYEVHVADITGNGYPDVVRRHQGGQNRLLFNEAGASPGQRRLVDRTMSAYPSEWTTIKDAVAADVDGDGDLDMIVAEWWTPTGSWTDPGTYWTSCASGSYYWFSPRSTYFGRVRLLLNDGAGNFFDFTEQRLPNVQVKGDQIAVADFSGNGAMDFVITDRSPNRRVRLFLNDGTGHFTESSYPNLPPYTERTGGIAAIDADGDGRPDIVIATWHGIKFWRNVGGGNFVDATAAYLPNLGTGRDTWSWHIAVGDLNGDGHDDLFIAMHCHGNKVLYWDPGLGTFVDRTSEKMPSASLGRGRAYLVDLNGNGNLDVLVANQTDDRLYLNTGDGYLADNTHANLPRAGRSWAYGLLDVNGDGLLDLVAISNHGTTALRQNRLLINTGHGVFAEAADGRITADTDVSIAACTGDFDGDGRQDLFVGNDGQSRVYLGVP